MIPKLFHRCLALLIIPALLSLPFASQAASVQISGQEVTEPIARDILDLTRKPLAVTDAATSIYPTTQAQAFTHTLAGNRTIDFQGHKAGRIFIVILRQDATGSRTVTWDTEVRWSGGTIPTLTTTASRTDVFRFVDTGTRYLGVTLALNYNEA